ncbi:type I-E CRISPR-associated protein Cse1/CasA [Actinomadura geliboluensis]|uniref:Type I-E CRISPR-associated protein Cse1/CasA n=1 Tax=Actinomadura geliboluensis TaxID=882440 RepID=A0A5S4GKV0_9ACTN|nr:type I-E CRISPR-associated protein Cse1/CasA [Actinomadura geliboluensis]TMR33596.1 type I-E CRISPR-associated protein Cse1/CasA [Actinomadura geliboluensis]
MVSRVSFDLVERRWADVSWLDHLPGHPSRVGLRDLFVHAHEIKALTLTPAPFLSAMYRLLYAMTSRITGLDVLGENENEDDWLDRRSELAGQPLDPAVVDRYFDEMSGRLDLFHPERPFLQDPRLADPEVCPKSAGVNKLVLGRPAGNNSVWFGHHWDAVPAPVPTVEAFAALLVWLYYGPSGRCATRKHGSVSAADVSAGPLRSSLSYHPEGATLLETLMAGLTPPPRKLRPGVDLCPWELDELPDPLAPPPEPDPYPGLRSRLTGGWQHALLLVPDETGENVTDAFVTWGRRIKQPSTNDAYLIHQISQQGNPYARPADASRDLWRDLDGLLQLKTTSTAQPRRPEAFDTVDELGSGTFKVRALGFEQDGKTKDVQFVSSATPPLLFRIQEKDHRRARRIGDLRMFGELYGRRLEYAAKRAWALVNSEDKVSDCAWADHAAAAYWPLAEDIFWGRMRREDYTDSWKPFLRAAASAFDEVTQGRIRSTRDARAIEQARIELYGGRRRTAAKPKRSS